MSSESSSASMAVKMRPFTKAQNPAAEFLDSQHHHEPTKLVRVSQPGSAPVYTYKLQKYHLRSLLTIIGPLFLLGFYVLICYELLVEPPTNDIVPVVRIDARWVFYVWFVAAIFALEWARSGLANIEAGALMKPHLAPRTAAALMWHTDTRWSNPIWWFKAVRFEVSKFLRRKEYGKIEADHGPTWLWLYLSATSFVLFISVPLSGLTMENASVSVYSDRRVEILGPNATTFNFRDAVNPQQQASFSWQSGRVVTPLYNAPLYAPRGTVNVSSTYFDDQAQQQAAFIEVFAGSAVSEPAFGQLWGMHANISCLPVAPQDLQMLQIHDVNNYSVKLCVPAAQEEENCTISWYNMRTQERFPISNVVFPYWFNQTGRARDYNFSMAIAADGWLQDRVIDRPSNPYIDISNHDNQTFDHISNGRAADDVTTAMFEIFVWESISDTLEADAVPADVSNGTSGPVVKLRRRIGNSATDEDVNFYGMGIQCSVSTAVGHAEIDPAHRTFSSFTREGASENYVSSTGDVPPIEPVQLTALRVLRNTTAADRITNTIGMWRALHRSINAVSLTRTKDVNYEYLALSPPDLQLAMYRLLGHLVIAVVDSGGAEPWYGEAFALVPSRYLVPGVLPWQVVLALLCLWTAMISGGGIWLALFAGPRWAPSLSAFEMFKFGARYEQEIDALESVQVEKCKTSLSMIPGMVGMLPGTIPSAATAVNTTGGGSRIGPDDNQKYGFIGLSETAADKHAVYTLDRKKAALTRYAVTTTR